MCTGKWDVSECYTGFSTETYRRSVIPLPFTRDVIISYSATQINCVQLMMTGNLSNLNIFSYVFFFFIFVHLDKSFLHLCMEMAFFVIYNCAIVASQCLIFMLFSATFLPNNIPVAPLLGWTPLSCLENPGSATAMYFFPLISRPSCMFSAKLSDKIK